MAGFKFPDAGHFCTQKRSENHGETQVKRKPSAASQNPTRLRHSSRRPAGRRSEEGRSAEEGHAEKEARQEEVTGEQAVVARILPHQCGFARCIIPFQTAPLPLRIHCGVGRSNRDSDYGISVQSVACITSQRKRCWYVPWSSIV